MEFYEILEIEKTATKDEIKRSYRRLAMKYHPDRNAGDKEAEAKFKKVNEAYQTLIDDNKRKQYDMFWKAGGAWGFWGGFGWGFWWVDVDLWDIFSDFFGWGARTRQKKSGVSRGEDIEENITIDLKTSIFGGKQKISFDKMSTCSECKWQWGSGKKSCGWCSWTGYKTYTQQSMFGVIQQTWACDECGWTWESFEKTCDICHGKKRTSIRIEKEIEIPAGIDDSMIIKMEWEWNDWIWTKQSWDLYLRFRVKLEEKGLTRDGINLYYDLEIEVVEAVLWTTKEISIPVIGKRKIEIPSWTTHWTVLKILWDWVKDVNYDTKWDLHINISIRIPKKLSKKEKELYLEIAKEKKVNVNNHKWIFEKLFG